MSEVGNFVLSSLSWIFILILGIEGLSVIFGFQSGIGSQIKELAPIFFMMIVVALLLAILDRLRSITDKSKQ